MKRAFLTAAAALFFVVLGRAHALAIGEFCPARLTYSAVGSSNSVERASDTFGLQLTAASSRTVAATLAFDTDAGWFTVALQGQQLAADTEHYKSDTVAFIRREWRSPVFYARFPKTVKITDAFVLNAQTSGEPIWDSHGRVVCAPAVPHKDRSPNRANDVELDPHDVVALYTAPGPSSTIVVPSKTSALFSTSCPDPFVEATAKSVEPVAYPPQAYPARGTTGVEILLNNDGTVADAETYFPSGVAAFDSEAVRAAKNSRYTAARAYCMPVPAFYIFMVTFDPR
jgi:TonB family protein